MTSPYATVLWENGKPYWLVDGRKEFIPPMTASTMGDTRAKAWGMAQGPRPGQSLLKTSGTWNSKTGKFDQGLNWSNLLSMGAGAAMAGPALGAAFGGGGGAGAGAGALGPSTAGNMAATAAGVGGAAPAGLTAAGGSGMSFMSTLNNVLGLGQQAKGLLGNVGPVATGAAGSLQEERLSQDAAARQRDASALQRARFAQDNPAARAAQAARGDVQSGIQDYHATFNPDGTYTTTGGLRPSLLGPNARQAGGEMGRQALMALMTKSDVPELSTPQHSGVLEKGLGATGFLSSIGSALGKLPAGQPPMQGGMQGPPDEMATMPELPMMARRTQEQWLTPEEQASIFTPRDWGNNRSLFGRGQA